MGNVPTADRILSLLADLYADQTGTEVDYIIVDVQEEMENCEEGA